MPKVTHYCVGCNHAGVACKKRADRCVPQDLLERAWGGGGGGGDHTRGTPACSPPVVRLCATCHKWVTRCHQQGGEQSHRKCVGGPHHLCAERLGHFRLPHGWRFTQHGRPTKPPPAHPRATRAGHGATRAGRGGGGGTGSAAAGLGGHTTGVAVTTAPALHDATGLAGTVASAGWQDSGGPSLEDECEGLTLTQLAARLGLGVERVAAPPTRIVTPAHQAPPLPATTLEFNDDADDHATQAAAAATTAAVVVAMGGPHVGGGRLGAAHGSVVWPHAVPARHPAASHAPATTVVATGTSATGGPCSPAVEDAFEDPPFPLPHLQLQLPGEGQLTLEEIAYLLSLPVNEYGQPGSAAQAQ